MSRTSFSSNNDFYNFVKAIAVSLGDLGFAMAHNELAGLFEIAWTTSSELIGEIGLACERILARDGKGLPAAVQQDLKLARNSCRKLLRMG